MGVQGNLPTGIKRYMRASPYRKRCALNREAAATDVPLQSVEGLSALDIVTNYVEEAADAGESAFVLVSGKTGTGRTSVCNHLLAHYREYLGIEKFAVPRLGIAGDDDFLVMKNWLKALLSRLRQAGMTPLGERGGLDLDATLTTLAGLERDTYRTDVNGWMALLGAVLAERNPRSGFGVCLEDVPTIGLIDAAFTIFEDSPTLVLVTIFEHQELLRDGFVSRLPHGTVSPPDEDHYPVLELGPVRGTEAKYLIESRWPQDRLPSPFEGADLAAAFDDKLRTAARIMVMTEKILTIKARSPGPEWPQARDLRFDSEELPELRDTVELLL